MALIPVLQLIHVSDIHFKNYGANPLHKLNASWRFFARFTQYTIERFDIGGWDEGTQGHYAKAPESFRRPGPWKLFNSCNLGSSLHMHAGIRQIGAQLFLPRTFWCSSAEMGDLYHWALG